MGRVLLEASGIGWAGDIKISPKGDLVAFIDHFYTGDDGSVAIVDLQGHKRTLTGNFTSLQGTGVVAERQGNLVYGSHGGEYRTTVTCSDACRRNAGSGASAGRSQVAGHRKRRTRASGTGRVWVERAVRGTPGNPVHVISVG